MAFLNFFIAELHRAVFNECVLSQFQILSSIPDAYLVHFRVLVNIRCMMTALMLGFKLEVAVKLNIEIS